MTKITIDRAVAEQALHVATGAGYPVALIAALKAALAEPQEPVAWTPVAEALPNSGVYVLACYRNRFDNLRRIRAMWTAAKTEEADSDDAEACSEYDEATDTYYVTEGWYECVENWGDYSSVAVTEGEVTHWMPLPPVPSTSPPQRPAEPVQEPDVPATNFGNMEPVGWLESPHGAFRANPLYKIQFPSQLLSWQIPVFAAHGIKEGT